MDTPAKDKDSEIKIRINKTDKEFLQRKAEEQNTTLSNYILTQCLSDTNDLFRIMPDAVELWDICNEISHLAQDAHDTELINDIRSRLSRFVVQTSQNQGEQPYEKR